MTTARYRPTWDLALDPLVSCKLCLGEYPVEQMTTIAQCQCIFCTLVGPLGRKQWLKHFQEEPLRLFFVTLDPTFARDRVSHAVPGRMRLGIRQAPQ